MTGSAIRQFGILLTGIFMLVWSALASAEAVRKEAQFDPEKSYLLFQLDPIKDGETGKNLQRGQVAFARYDPEAEDIRGGGRAVDNPVPQGETLRVRGFKNQLIKQKKRRLYLLEVDPGVWTIEATGIGQSSAPPDFVTSFSLASQYFEVGQGEIIDLGVLTPVNPGSDNPDTKLNTGKVLKAMFLLGSMKIEAIPLTLEMRERKTDDIELPAWIASRPLRAPELVYGARFSNYAGGLINRIDGKAGRERAASEAAASGEAANEVVAEAPVAAATQGAADESLPDDVSADAPADSATGEAPADVSAEGAFAAPS